MRLYVFFYIHIEASEKYVSINIINENVVIWTESTKLNFFKVVLVICRYAILEILLKVHTPLLTKRLAMKNGGDILLNQWFANLLILTLMIYYIINTHKYTLLKT